VALPPEFGRTLPYCWACRKLLADAGGKPDLQREEHHIIPRAQGGGGGPTVSLCNAHHDLLHRISLKLISNTRYFDLVPKDDPVLAERVLYLATRVQIAVQHAKGDPNKQFPIILSISGEENEQIKRLVKATNSGSKQKLIKQLISQAYTKYFPTK